MTPLPPSAPARSRREGRETLSSVVLEIVFPTGLGKPGICKNNFANSVGILDGDRPAFTKLARVVVQLGQSQDVFGYLNDVTFSKLDGDREGDGNLEAVVARDASFKAICVQKAVAACPLPEDATLDGILASFSDVRMVVIAVQALAARACPNFCVNGSDFN